MTLSPFEVERQEFGKAAMGYRRAEVDSFLDEVRLTLQSLWQERSDLREENERLNERIARFTALEEQLKNTLLLAQDSAEKAQEQARRESELLMREAGQKAREIVHAAHEERQRLESALRDLQAAEGETRQRFRALAQTVVQHLDDSKHAVADSASTLRAIVHGQGRQSNVPRNTPLSGRAAEADTQTARRATTSTDTPALTATEQSAPAATRQPVKN